MTFSLDTAALSAGVSDSVVSLTPLFLAAASLLIAAGVLSWGAVLIGRWRQGR